jgi:uncharacterized protein (DUF58 family)
VLTARGWWFFLVTLTLLALGVVRAQPMVVLVTLTLLGWFAWEWLLFAARTRVVVRGLHLTREVSDEHGPVDTLWAGRTFQVRTRLTCSAGLGLPYAVITDRVPLDAELIEGRREQDGPIAPSRPLECAYTLHCGGPGRLRFEGLGVRLADLQGFFFHRTFVRAPAEYRVLPPLSDARGHFPTVKRHNLLPPPGLHRLRRPGSGSELLDLRDYLPGDPPKTIAWKASARRDRLITKEFESDVPVRCTLLLDTSNSVRVGPAGQNALARLVEIAAAVAQANAGARDLTGLFVFDETGASYLRPARGERHLVEVLNRLADVAGLAPSTGAARVETLVPLAHGFAQEVYPDLMRPEINRVPFWLPWLQPQPAYTVRAPRPADYFNAFLPLILVLFTAVAGAVFVALFVLSVRFSLDILANSSAENYGRGASPLVTTALAVALLAEIIVLGTLFYQMVRRLPILFPVRRRLYRWHKRLAALLSVQHNLAPGGLALLMEDDERFVVELQRFLAAHHVPYPLPLYDRQGHYRFASPAKLEVLAEGLLRSVGKGHDNELFVLLADLLELPEQLGPLLQAVKVALARHHRVVLICPWPPQVPPPAESGPPFALPADESPDAQAVLQGELRRATTIRLHRAFQRLRWTFARLGVPVICAQSEDPVRLVLERLDRLRAQGRRR